MEASTDFYHKVQNISVKLPPLSCSNIDSVPLGPEKRPGKRQHGDQQEDRPAGGLAQNRPGVSQTGDGPLPGRYLSLRWTLDCTCGCWLTWFCPMFVRSVSVCLPGHRSGGLPPVEVKDPTEAGR